MILPMVASLSQSQVHSLVTSGLATIDGSTLGAFINFGVRDNHLRFNTSTRGHSVSPPSGNSTFVCAESAVGPACGRPLPKTCVKSPAFLESPKSLSPRSGSLDPTLDVQWFTLPTDSRDTSGSSEYSLSSGCPDGGQNARS